MFKAKQYIQVKYVMRDISQNNHTLTVLLYRYNIFMPVHLHLLSFLMTMSIANVTRLCQDYAMVHL